MPAKRFLGILLTGVFVCTLLLVPTSAANPQYAEQLLEGQTYTVEQAAAVRGAVEYMPENLMAYLMESGLQVDTVSDCPGAERSTGACAATWKNIVYVYETAQVKNVIHEFGHAYAKLLSINPHSLYARYKDSLQDILPAHGTSEMEEFWADCFAYTIIDPDGIGKEIASVAPAVANILREVLEHGGNLYTEGNMGSLNMFGDVHSMSWYAAAVNEAALRGIVSGKSSYSYDPLVTVTRAEGIQGVFNLRRHADVSPEYLPNDVSLFDWYADAAKWAVKYNAIMPDQKIQFDPYQTITREEMVLAMYSLTWSAGIHQEGTSDLSEFLDADHVSPDCRAALNWAITYGVIAGTDQGILDPKGSLTRAQMAAMLVNVSHYLEEYKPEQ